MNVNENDWRYLKVLERCEDTSRIGYVYIIRAETADGEYKVGRSKNVPDRMRLFAVKLPFDFEIICFFPCDDMVETEGSLHELLKENHIRGEWFDIPPDLLNTLKNTAYSIDGSLVLNRRRQNWQRLNRPVRYVKAMFWDGLFVSRGVIYLNG